MFPGTIIISHFLYGSKIPIAFQVYRSPDKEFSYETGFISERTLQRVFPHGSVRELLEVYIGKVFAFENCAYRIKEAKVQEDTRANGLEEALAFRYLVFTLEEYTDATVLRLKDNLRKTKENLSVCADSVEDIGELHMANTIRGYAEDLVLASLVPCNIKDTRF